MGGGAHPPSSLVFDNTGVFIGGLPGYFNSRLGELTLPSVVFEPRFRGAVRNLVYGAIGGSGAAPVVKPQEIVESKVRPELRCSGHVVCQPCDANFFLIAALLRALIAD